VTAETLAEDGRSVAGALGERTREAGGGTRGRVGVGTFMTIYPAIAKAALLITISITTVTATATFTATFTAAETVTVVVVIAAITAKR
jgi:hypothetical protein